MKPWAEGWAAAAQMMMSAKLNPLQQEIEDWWLASDARVCQLLGGERSGKSFEAARLAMLSMRLGKPTKKRLYWIVGPDYLQARPEWKYLYEWFSKGDWVQGEPSMPSNIAAPWSFETVMEQQIVTRSASDIMKLASFSVDGVIMAEAAQQVNEAYFKLLGRVSETRGFLLLAGTLENGLPWYEDLYKRWQGPNVLNARSFSMPSWSNTAIYPGGREDPAIKELESETPEDIFLMRYAAVPRKNFGAVIKEFDFATHVKHLEVVEKAPVELWVDPGKNCYAVLFVQSIGLYTHVLDRVYTRGQIAHDVIPQVMANPLFKLVNKSSAGVIDIAAQQEHGNKSNLTLWKEIAGCSFRFQYIHEDVLIQTIRYRMGDKNPHHEPLVYFNDHMTNAKAPDGTALDVLAEFELWKWPERGFRQNEAKRPIDKNNHAIKALGYGLVDRYGAYVEKKPIIEAVQEEYWIPVR